MDAAEADADVKLYKASGELLLELQAKVPRLVKHKRDQNTFRKWVNNSKVYEVVKLLDAFQEWPQLLDPHLTSLIQVLVDAYLWYCVHHPREYLRKHTFGGQLSPLSQAVASVLYSFCKVRGRKVIIRLLNNEPKYVEPLLSCFQIWTATATSDSQTVARLTWEERYIHILWLSHLILAPFELSSISGFQLDTSHERRPSMLPPAMPNVACSLAEVGLDHLYDSSKAREAATILLVRLSLRIDMLKIEVSNILMKWIVVQLQTPLEKQVQPSGYHFIGLLGLLFGILHSSSDSEAAPFVLTCFQLAHLAATSQEAHFIALRDLASARKLLVKIMRSAVIHAMALDNTGPSIQATFNVNTMLEECIQALLELLADKDTPVRQAASKSLSLICLKMDTDMAAEVVDAIVESLNENVFLEDVKDGQLFAITDVTRTESVNYRKNLNAVDPLQWHGCMLTLGHLLFRRSLPIHQLQGVIEALLMGLNFEQRSNVGTSIGVGVRDAACFGLWSLARKYSTIELNTVPITKTLSPYPSSYGTGDINTLQLIATHLIMSACLDPSGNLRRGSSAALQELIGRHPDVIVEGISVVQTVDYHAVARRSRAVTEVAVAASELSGHYHASLLYALLGWRGVRATDADSRRQAATAAELLIETAAVADALTFLHELVSQILLLKASNSGTNAAVRHGLLCMLASVFKSFVHKNGATTTPKFFKILQPIIEDIAGVAGIIDGRTSTDLENVFEAVSKLILEIAHTTSAVNKQRSLSILPMDVHAWTSMVLSILDHCTISTEKPLVTDVAARANVAALSLLEENNQETVISSWLDEKQQPKLRFTCRGRITTLGQVSNALQSTSVLSGLHHRIIRYLCSIITSSYAIETKVNAMQSITANILTNPDLQEQDLDLVLGAVKFGLSDYTVDQRGDIGSLLRFESIAAVKQLNLSKVSSYRKQQMTAFIVRLAAEKLIKVRFQAWLCLREFSNQNSRLSLGFKHLADVSSVEYFQNLLVLLEQPQDREALLLGLISSVAGGTEDVSRDSSKALIAYMYEQDGNLQQAIFGSVSQCMAKCTTNPQSLDDRDVVSVIEFVAFFIEHIVAPQSDLAKCVYMESIWTSIQKVHTTATSILRIEAVIKVYSTFAMVQAYNLRALDRLTRLLLHRWPKIRGAAADTIALYTLTEAATTCDWNAPAAENKSTVVKIRNELNVAGVSVPGS